MNRNRSTYIIIIIVILLIAVFYFRSYNNENDEFQTDKQILGIDRNIDELIITEHAECRMDCRDVTQDEIKSVLQRGIINYSKSNMKDKRGPSYALEGYGDDRQHLRIVFAPKNNKLVVVTCIDLDKEWQCDCN